MNILIFILITIATWFIGVFGFCQIIGSIQYVRVRAIPLTLFTVLFWVSVLGIITTIILMFLNTYKVALFIGYIVALLMSLSAGKQQ